MNILNRLLLTLVLTLAACSTSSKEPVQPANHKETFLQTLIKADRGDADAQFQMGIYNLNGLDRYLEKDLRTASNWFKKAADQNHAESIHNLGVMYFDGNYYEKSDTEAYQYFIKSAELGFAPSQYNVAIMNYHAKGVKKDLEKSKFWSKKCAGEFEPCQKFLEALAQTEAMEQKVE